LATQAAEAMGQCGIRRRPNGGMEDPARNLEEARRPSGDNLSGLQDVGQPESANKGYFMCDIQEMLEMQGVGRSTAVPENGKPFTFKSGAVYIGQWKGFVRDGFGTQRWADGASYSGQWKDNMAAGLGRFTHTGGDVFIGEWAKNVAHGKGIYYHRDLTKYEGEWSHDRQDGYGVETWGDGSKYSGSFRLGDKHGFGVYMWPNGSQFTGSWVGSHFEGLGVFLGTDGKLFKGSWQGSVIHGRGKYIWADGREYHGQYTMDKKDGFGVFKWPDGRKYEGYWSNDKEHGAGKCTTQDGIMQVAQFTYGVGSTPRSYRAEQGQQTLDMFCEARATPRSARTGNTPRSARNKAEGKGGTPRSNAGSSASSSTVAPGGSTKDFSNTDERSGFAGIPEMPDEDTGDMEDETHGNLSSLRK